MRLQRLLSVAVFGRLAVATATCYFPEGNVATDYMPCSDSGDSFCCNEDSICLSNGLCISMHQPYVLGRGACTTKSWNDTSVCDDVCHGITTAWGTACSLILYSDVDGEQLYCPNSIISNGTSSIGCADGVSPIKVATGSPIFGVAFLADATVLTNSSDTSTTTTTSTNVTTSSSNTTTCAVSTTTTDDANVARKSNDVSHSTLVAVGAGVGVPLGIIALASLAFAYYERQKRVRLQQAPPAMYQVSQGGYDVASTTASGVKTFPGRRTHELDEKITAAFTRSLFTLIGVNFPSEDPEWPASSTTGTRFQILDSQPFRLTGPLFCTTPLRQTPGGAFNICYRVRYEDGVHVIVRFAALGRAIPRREKLENEVATMRYLRQNTSIPVPEVFGSGIWDLGSAGQDRIS
ncbi:hypothetical protein BO70DRAFT_429164 [Aspergillus heteromorphus CBS 117.55]|uniref:Transmembrane protein n=1 Tax=Aspergillus heteromorphus CBS 117.55 TaxID=1448321 RepID=A0A317WAQ8_9EURO|nr:uncharacterized protein BO70DRAFT_429164 [Aspergillus heteromorphus CBS 117.55]PWY82078.1 hypothetical protein BO70DRAFT_429164 [Aspergillus heteromorphus CBS 117.55]